MAYTVKQLAHLAGVSARTLHYYDEIGLLKPTRYGDNGYRYYEVEAVLRLQQILFFRELGLSLKAIREIIDGSEFDLLDALRAHRQALRARVKRLNGLITTVDRTILHLEGQINMNTEELFDGFSEEKQAEYEAEARARYGDEEVDEANRRWNSYSPAQQERIKAESKAIYRDLLVLMDKGPDSPEVQQVIARWHQHMRYFYEPSRERLLGLGQLYVEQPEFAATYRKLHPDMPEFLQRAITHYCQGLESST